MVDNILEGCLLESVLTIWFNYILVDDRATFELLLTAKYRFWCQSTVLCLLVVFFENRLFGFLLFFLCLTLWFKLKVSNLICLNNGKVSRLLTIRWGGASQFSIVYLFMLLFIYYLVWCWLRKVIQNKLTTTNLWLSKISTLQILI